MGNSSSRDWSVASLWTQYSHQVTTAAVKTNNYVEIEILYITFQQVILINVRISSFLCLEWKYKPTCWVSKSANEFNECFVLSLFWAVSVRILQLPWHTFWNKGGVEVWADDDGGSGGGGGGQESPDELLTTSTKDKNHHVVPTFENEDGGQLQK